MAGELKLLRPERDWMEVEDSLWKALSLHAGKGTVLSAVGAGGKTSTLTRLAWERMILGKKAAVSTTTHMMKPKRWNFFEAPDSMAHPDAADAELTARFERNLVFWMGKTDPRNDKKFVAPDLAYFHAVEQMEDTVLLLEADGARKLPFKLPGPEEPVLLPETTLVLAVLGLDALNRPWREQCFRFEHAREYFGEVREIITEDDYVELLSSPYGLKKGVSASMEYRVLLGKADTREACRAAVRIRRKLRKRGIDQVYAVCYHHDFLDRWL